MKLNRLLIASLLGFSLLTTSALACEHSSGSSSNQESHWSFFGWCHRTDNSRCDHDKNSGSSNNNCDRGKGNDGRACSTGGSTSGGGSSTGGSTTAGGGKGIS